MTTVESWRPWTLDNATQMAGYVTTYNKVSPLGPGGDTASAAISNSNKLTHPAREQAVGMPGSFLFTTVRGAGHMVPRCEHARTSPWCMMRTAWIGPPPNRGRSLTSEVVPSWRGTLSNCLPAPGSDKLSCAGWLRPAGGDLSGDQLFLHSQGPPRLRQDRRRVRPWAGW